MSRKQHQEDEVRRRHRRAFFWAYLTLALTLVGILVTVAGVVLVILKKINFHGGWRVEKANDHHVYMGHGIPSDLGLIVLIVGLALAVIGYIGYRLALSGIDRHVAWVKSIQQRSTITEAESFLPESD